MKYTRKSFVPVGVKNRARDKLIAPISPSCWKSLLVRLGVSIRNDARKAVLFCWRPHSCAEGHSGNGQTQVCVSRKKRRYFCASVDTTRLERASDRHSVTAFSIPHELDIFGCGSGWPCAMLQIVLYLNGNNGSFSHGPGVCKSESSILLVQWRHSTRDKHLNRQQTPSLSIHGNDRMAGKPLPTGSFWMFFVLLAIKIFLSSWQSSTMKSKKQLNFRLLIRPLSHAPSWLFGSMRQPHSSWATSSC